jgi:diguanylate cyclase (GGDEF)-like protein
LAETAVPAGLWLWAALTLVLTAVLAFAGGIAFARMSSRRAIERARQHVARLVPIVLESLRTADDACRTLAGISAWGLSTTQLEQLAASRTRLLETWQQIDLRQQEQELQAELDAQRTARMAEFQARWTREPADEGTGLPDRSAFDANLQLVLSEGAQADVESGLLVVRIDRYDQLRKRFGLRGAQQIGERMARLLCRLIRDKDLVCRFAIDTFAVLMPGMDAASGDRLAATIRDTVRDHHFQLDKTGPEVFVTASFGYTSLRGDDSVELAVGRAVHALSRSERRGRNQLHLHDGNRVVHSAAV